ncbi:nuclear pore complex protein NUP1-like [Gossypium hirsutum]|uniref:Nuclear pore complex protein NUP1-like n=1 Tax=Gossypium hirsutum TaxID=3635 RepID=A0ABM2ZVF5_GOSHI|nr:nuclear pore complex protein NUP1-like [Gossypium hirsutum]
MLLVDLHHHLRVLGSKREFLGSTQGLLIQDLCISPFEPSFCLDSIIQWIFSFLSSCATTAPGTTNYLSDKTDKESNLNGIFCRTPEAAITSSVSTSISAGSKFKFGASADGYTFYNGSSASSPFSFSSLEPSLVPSNCQSSSSATATKNDSSAATITSASATANASNSFTSSLSVEASIPSFTGPPVFKFSSSGDPSTSVSTLSATSGEATESKTQDTKLGNVGIFPFGSTSAFTGSGSSIFGGTSAASSSAGTTAEVASSGSSSSSGISSTITNSGSGFFSSTFSPVTSTSNGIFGGTSASTSTGNGIFGCTSATTSTGTGLFGDTSATTSTGNGISGGTSATSTVSSIFGGTSFPESGTGSSIFAAKAAVTITGSNIFGFSAPATSTSASQSQGLNPFNAVNTQASAAGTGIGSSTQSTPIQFSSFASSSSFGLTGNATFSSGSSIFGSSASVAKPFSSGSSFGISSSFSETKSLSSSSGIAGGAFGSTWQAPKTPTFGSSSGFSFGSSTSVSAPSGASSIFGSSTGASSSSIFSFTSAAAATPSLPVFGNTSPGLVFGSTPSSNNDQMEDSMVEDTVQASPAVVTFSQQPISPPASGFVFGASNPPAAGSVPFGTRPSMAAPQNPSPFLASGSWNLVVEGASHWAPMVVTSLPENILEELLIVAVCCSHQNVIDAGTNKLVAILYVLPGKKLRQHLELQRRLENPLGPFFSLTFILGGSMALQVDTGKAF